MYFSMLSHVVSLIEKTVPANPTFQDKMDFQMNSMFSPEAYKDFMDKQRRNQDIRTKLIVGVTSVAVLGEAVHLAKRSKILDKLKKK